MEGKAIPKLTAVHWTPEGKGQRGRPRTTWRRTTPGETSKRKLVTGMFGEALSLPLAPTAYRAVSNPVCGIERDLLEGIFCDRDQVSFRFSIVFRFS
ncbi:hypothetical protein ACROYT_G044449 [Oculina patagonica]